jgi:hypothetical protein
VVVIVVCPVEFTGGTYESTCGIDFEIKVMKSSDIIGIYVTVLAPITEVNNALNANILISTTLLKNFIGFLYLI